jgi:hypothetical protein
MINLAMLCAMRHSPVRNYVVPGLTSWLIGNPSPAGTMRLFECSRDHQENITPHSHRFDFQCWVLTGSVRNRVWRETSFSNEGDLFQRSSLTYDGEIGGYQRQAEGVKRYVYTDTAYEADQWYSMQAHEIHSINFARGTEVLFFEGPTITNVSQMLEPFVNGAAVPTFEVKPWMFQKEAA